MYSGGPYDFLYQMFWLAAFTLNMGLCAGITFGLTLSYVQYADSERSVWEDGPDKWWWWTTVNPYSAGRTNSGPD